MASQMALASQTGRLARCSCGVTRPSSPDLAFFEDRAEGTRAAVEICGQCGMSESAHLSEDPRIRNPVRIGECPGFEPHGAWEFDLFYCGCRGWD